MSLVDYIECCLLFYGHNFKPAAQVFPFIYVHRKASRTSFEAASAISIEQAAIFRRCPFWPHPDGGFSSLRC
jgi:hypothetical protein